MLNKEWFYKHLCKNIHLPAFLSVNAAVPVFKNQMSVITRSSNVWRLHFLISKMFLFAELDRLNKKNKFTFKADFYFYFFSLNSIKTCNQCDLLSQLQFLITFAGIRRSNSFIFLVLLSCIIQLLIRFKISTKFTDLKKYK